MKEERRRRKASPPEREGESDGRARVRGGEEKEEGRPLVPFF